MLHRFFGKKPRDVEPTWEIFVQPDWVERETYDHKGIKVTISEPGWSWYARTVPFSIWELGTASGEQAALSAALSFVEAARG